MREQHLSDEAVAAFADDVLGRSARERARRHITACPECAHAVAVQREAVWALRSAGAPALPTGLLDRLRDVPTTTPIRQLPTHVTDDGTAMFATVAGAAALVPPRRSGPEQRGARVRPIALTVATLAAIGALTGAAMAADSGTGDSGSTRPGPVSNRVSDQPLPAPGSDARFVHAVLPLHAW
jgi:anti-sigma factor RsiW